MIISDTQRLWLYISASVWPIWVAFFTTSTDYSLRGLAIPVLASLNAATVVALARTRGNLIDGGTVTVVAPPGEPLKVEETKPPQA